jgi:hypothetical protein
MTVIMFVNEFPSLFCLSMLTQANIRLRYAVIQLLFKYSAQHWTEELSSNLLHFQSSKCWDTASLNFRNSVWSVFCTSWTLSDMNFKRFKKSSCCTVILHRGCNWKLKKHLILFNSSFICHWCNMLAIHNISLPLLTVAFLCHVLVNGDLFSSRIFWRRLMSLESNGISYRIEFTTLTVKVVRLLILAQLILCFPKTWLSC